MQSVDEIFISGAERRKGEKESGGKLRGIRGRFVEKKAKKQKVRG